jgi:hypothetical protein
LRAPDCTQGILEAIAASGDRGLSSEELQERFSMTSKLMAKELQVMKAQFRVRRDSSGHTRQSRSRSSSDRSLSQTSLCSLEMNRSSFAQLVDAFLHEHAVVGSHKVLPLLFRYRLLMIGSHRRAAVRAQGAGH